MEIEDIKERHGGMMFHKVKEHYAQSVKVHTLLGRVRKELGLQAKIDLLRQVKEINSTYDPSALPKGFTKVLEWHIANVRPLLLPIGSYRPLFLTRMGLLLRRFMLCQ